MAPSMKCLPCKDEKLSLIPNIRMKKPGMCLSAIPTLLLWGCWNKRLSGTCWLNDLANHLAPDSVRNPVEKIMWRVIEEDTRHWPLASAYIFTWTCTHRHTHTDTHQNAFLILKNCSFFFSFFLFGFLFVWVVGWFCFSRQFLYVVLFVLEFDL